MKGICADRMQKTGAVGVFYTYRGMRWDGTVHGFLATDERCVSLRSSHRRILITVYFV